jgi:hypothetical protein
MTTEIQQQLPWFGGNYAAGFDGARSTSNNFFSNFNPQLQSSISFNYTQPLLRGLKIDSARQQLQLSQKNREIADVGLRETLTATSRSVRNAYWDLAYQNAALRVAQESLALAEESLRNTKSRVEIGTTPPIDIVEAEAEVATRQEAVIVAERRSRRLKTTSDNSSTTRRCRTSGRYGSIRSTCHHSSRYRSTSMPPFGTHSIAGRTWSGPRNRWRPPTSAFSSCRTKRCPT